MTVTTEASLRGEMPAQKKEGPLLPVLRVIPSECYERSRRRGDLLVARSLAVYAAVLAGLVFADAWWLVMPLWVLAGLAVSGLFVLGHDCAHGALYDDAARNRRIGRALMLPSLHVYESWIVDNRIHHGHTLRQGVDFVWHPLTVEQFRALGWLARLRHRVEWSPFGAGLYYMREVWWNKMMRFTAPARNAANVRRDERFVAVGVLGAVTVAAAIGWLLGSGPFGALWFVAKLVVVPFLAFCWTIGFTVYVHHIAPGIKWWPRHRWNSFHGQVEGTTVLRIPAVFNFFLHDIFVHVPHHVDVRIPCYELNRAADAIIAAFPDVDHRRFRFGDYLAATKACKLYDFEAQQWLPYSAANPMRNRVQGVPEGSPASRLPS